MYHNIQIQKGMTYLFHISLKKLDEKELMFIPRVPDTRGGGENDRQPRICVSETLRGCINGILSCHIHYELMRCRGLGKTELELFVYKPASDIPDDALIQTGQLVNSRFVQDAERTGEKWIVSPTKMKLHSVLEVTNVEESFPWLDFADFSFEDFPFQIEYKVKEFVN